MPGMNKPAVKRITDAIGTDPLCRRLSVSEHSIRHARTTGVFPASWYAPVDEMCRSIGIECPKSAFNFKSIAAAPEREAS